MTRAEFLSRVAERMGFAETQDAEACTRRVLETLGERLSRLESEALAAELPPGIDSALQTPEHGQDFELEAFYGRVQRRGDVIAIGRAREEAIVVCGVLAEAVGEDALQRLRIELPREYHSLLALPEHAEPARTVHLHREHRTLAEGRGGSEHPLYEARPERAHTHSVARSGNPHGDTKLSSATGMTQEREEETLSTGRPGSERPISEAEEGPTR